MAPVLETRITDKMGVDWCTILKQDMAPSGALPNDWIYRLRTHPWYRTFIWAMKWYILPDGLCPLVLVYRPERREPRLVHPGRLLRVCLPDEPTSGVSEQHLSQD